MLVVEHPFQLPKGYIDQEGTLHRDGVMRLATAADEILIMNDPRVRAMPSYVIVLLLSRVIVRLGTLPHVNPGLIEGIFTEDTAYLQEFYNRINGMAPREVTATCPNCEAKFQTEVPVPGGS